MSATLLARCGWRREPEQARRAPGDAAEPAEVQRQTGRRGAIEARPDRLEQAGRRQALELDAPEQPQALEGARAQPLLAAGGDARGHERAPAKGGQPRDPGVAPP